MFARRELCGIKPMRMGRLRLRVYLRPDQLYNSRKNCGNISDGCGGVLNCGTFVGSQTCGGSGIANVCGTAGCTPISCVAEGKNCDSISDRCGGNLDCGICGGSQTCDGSGIANVCGTAGCTPTTCVSEGKNCGSIPDGCQGSLNCGACTSPDTCAGGGESNVCGCNAVSSCGGSCGVISDGCGGTINCGICPGDSCQLGRYEGPFQGTIAGFEVSGTVTLRIVNVGGDIRVVDSEFEASGGLGTVFQIIEGSSEFDCEAGTLSETGSGLFYYYATDPIPITTTSTASYDKGTSSFFNGVWTFDAENTVYTGTGTWHANWVGP